MTATFDQAAGAAHQEIRTFHPRRSPLSRAQREALTHLWPGLGFSIHNPANGTPPSHPDGTLDTTALFGRRAPVVLEIGSGMGEATVAMAAADPDRDYLAVDVHIPGIATLLQRVDTAGVGNVRVAHGDAMTLVREHVAPSSLDAVHVFFPDPWPKARHHKRRLVQERHVRVLTDRLRPGGTLHCATDWDEYAEQMLTVLTAPGSGLTNPHQGYAPRPPHRPVTKFEQRGLDLGHTVRDVVVHRA
ncbi:tRNA (guanosine(46)-N7)-methyltransferase TrmB [Cellulomonas bogoriensis]|uniref:tRNA (guanine-N(7)-)-methyltransferase n=1 Tax=Cellulomonas bogoriensis 69B4 = DSM 16987 TaxID=1386082 RepID=A0A0A0BYX0_9CELL|nr:tRNA (guanosine(46)-N7)-methyltransferase TrmB [Cellulomonas bogoriensis]KGM13145.1 tRNA (guanine-N7)-methyltransferase [Cellulomonas bogoriensis 69B4 = DSM 16987]